MLNNASGGAGGGTATGGGGTKGDTPTAFGIGGWSDSDELRLLVGVFTVSKAYHPPVSVSITFDTAAISWQHLVDLTDDDNISSDANEHTMVKTPRNLLGASMKCRVGVMNRTTSVYDQIFREAVSGCGQAVGFHLRTCMPEGRSGVLVMLQL